jgi:hypothetical protein
MARTSIRTLLSLDRYAKIMGINPVFFNGGDQINLPTGNVLFPIDNAQNNIWHQYSWQQNDQISREDLAEHISVAENEIINYLGYSPVPMWTAKERYNTPKYLRPEYRGNNLLYDVSGLDFEIKIKHGYFISGGRRTASILSPTVAVNYTDDDGDGWKEIATITIATLEDPIEVKCYFVGHGGDPSYEIREPKSKTLNAGVIAFKYNTWQMVEPDLYEVFPMSDANNSIDFYDDTNFVGTVDIYREYTDTTQPHAVFITNDVSDGYPYWQNGFVYSKDQDYVCPVQGDYDLATQSWVRVYAQCIVPDYVDLWYYSGMRQHFGSSYSFDDYMPNDFARAIAYMATARLERVFYANNNATSLATELRDDYLVSGQGTFKGLRRGVDSNPFGSKVGEYKAWQLMSRYKTSNSSSGATV